MESLVGRTLKNGKYLIDRELGQGGFGITYKAIHLETNEPVVIKTLKKASVDSPHRDKVRKQFLQEANRLFECKHSNIVRYLTFFEENKQPFIVMDYIPGSTLDRIVTPDNPLPEATAIEYIRQIAEALKVVHRKGLLHRDVKPQNLILHSKTKQVVLIDFGISREFSQGKTKTHTNLISEGYAPLEQYLPKAKRTAATDVYGLAATLYTLLTAQIPIAPTLRDRIPLMSPREIQPHISQGVNDAVMAGMAIEAKDRPSTVDKWLNLLLNPRNRSTIPIAPIAGKSNYNDRRHSELVNLPSTAKEEDLYYSRPKNKFPLPLKAIVFASILGFGFSYVWSRIEPISIGNPNIEEIIKKNSSNKELNSQNLQIDRQAIKTTKKFEQKARANAGQERIIKQEQEKAEQEKAARLAEQEKAEQKRRLEQQQEAKRLAEQKRLEQQQEAKRLAEQERLRRKQEADRLAAEKKRFWQQLAAEKKRLWQQQKAKRRDVQTELNIAIPRLKSFNREDYEDGNDD